ncbi:MAG TPA: caspase family protein [Pseudomonadota bacterium]|nr:caspase family protein [Rhodanobacteraceae bacterium]MBP9155475.1 caspase family protein [Xanthomonadales bacterium]HQW80910.1 caspase family protein [Pseudomonadota bacterium]
MAVSNTLHAYALSVAIAATMVLVALPVNAPRASIRNAEDMMIVDCLLPGTVRKLGKMSTYMSARRPIRTIQSDCEIRGGEYVAYDRANYETALKVWMAQAESGDAEAQNYVGEIYDKGLGIAPDPTRAAPWYEKAAAQGLKRAKINLGYLYEQGLGVPKDMTHALNLYRDASGLIGDDLVYASTMTAAVSAKEGEIAGLRQDIEQQKAAADRLRTENEKLKSELGSRKHAVETAQVELQKARDELAAKQSQLGAATPDMIALNDKLAREQERIELERAKLEQDQRRHAAQRDADQKRLTDLRAQETTLDAQVRRGGADAAKATAELKRVRAAASDLALELDAAIGRMTTLETALKQKDAQIKSELEKFDAERKQMQSAVAASKEDRELLLLLEQQLTSKQREVVRQRAQISALEQRVGGPGSAAILAGNGPMVEILEPALTVTRGRTAALAPRGDQTEVVGKVIARGGLQSLLINGTAVTVGADGLFRARMPVDADGTNVSVTAVDQTGSRSGIEFLLLPSDVIAGSSGGVQRAIPGGVKLGRYHAVVIGNNQYADYPALGSAANDADKVAAVLSRRYGFTTTLLKNANRFEILSALNAKREALGPDDNLVVYFAGHGEIDAATKQGYWIPADGRQNAPASWLSNRAISDILNTMNAKHVLVVADSCYSGAMTRAAVPTFSSAMPDKAWSQWVKTMSQSRSRTALTSGGLAPVPDTGRGNNSHFALALIAALEDNAQLLEGQRLFREVSSSLALAAAESSLVQIPEYAPIQFAGHEAGEFFFQPKAGAVATTVSFGDHAHAAP